MLGRRTPYTKIGLRRLSCVRCGDPASRQVVFSIDDLWRPLCTECDEKLNLLYLVFLNDPDVVVKIAKYRELTDALTRRP